MGVHLKNEPLCGEVLTTNSVFLKRILYNPTFPKITRGIRTEKLGSRYGSKCYAVDAVHHGSTIISAGCGEDISFDIEFAAKWGANIVLIDPTPRAITHVKDVLAACGQGNTRTFGDTGKQAVESYNLREISQNQLTLIEKALWIESGEITFYPPRDPKHVSYSISDIQNDNLSTAVGITVSSITLGGVLEDLSLSEVPLLKLDIEGAEIEVLEQMFESAIFPDQVLVEFDELLYPSRRGSQRIARALKILREQDYICFARNNADFSFIRKGAL